MSTTTKHNWKLDPVHRLNCASRYGRKCNCPTNASDGTVGGWSVHEGEDYVVVLGGEYDTTENPIAQCFDVQIAAQIVTDHKAAIHEGGPRAYLYSELQHALKSQALLVEALEVLRSTLTPILRDHAVRGNVDRTEGYVLVVVNQIDAALKAASGLTE